MTYEQAFKDWEFLWGTIGSADDMTGAYVDQEDLDKLLRKPTKGTAKKCLCNQIDYWFQTGPDKSDLEGRSFDDLCSEYSEIEEIMDRHFIYGGWE